MARTHRRLLAGGPRDQRDGTTANGCPDGRTCSWCSPAVIADRRRKVADRIARETIADALA